MFARPRQLLTVLIPFGLRVEGHRLVRAVRDGLSGVPLSTRKAPATGFGHRLAEARSPLERVAGALPAGLQRGKEINVALAARAIDSVVIVPGQLFSYHRLVGRPSRLRGFRLGLELQDNEESAGVGGGCCQVSNMLYWLAVNAGLDIVERHRHGFDLFPDHRRSVPFGCGATVFYNYRDLRFANPLGVPVRIGLSVEDESGHVDRPERAWTLVGRIDAEADPGVRVTVEQRGHRFFCEDGVRMRENRIHRRTVDAAGRVIEDAELAHNLCEVKYDPPEEERS